jgi:steroid 5-alpha reductase family enzyme
MLTPVLVYATGARRTEKYLANRPGYDEYRSRTAFFVPAHPDRDYYDDARVCG